MTVYYNELDDYAARWLENLIAAGYLPPGDVDRRDIREVSGDDLEGYEQCHFFAGIGGWPLALRLAGWQGPVWTGSCPCQPLSSAGQRKGHADERHLWPAFHGLIAERRPATVFGEQVASKDGREWVAGVRADLEDLGYACGAADLCAAGVGEKAALVDDAAPCSGCGRTWDYCECALPGPFRGQQPLVLSAPHIRQRLFWVADADVRHAGAEGLQRGGQHGQQAQDGRIAGGLADAGQEQRRRRPVFERTGGKEPAQRNKETIYSERCGATRRLADAGGDQCRAGRDSGPDGRPSAEPAGLCLPRRLGDADRDGSRARRSAAEAARPGRAAEPDGDAGGLGDAGRAGSQEPAAQAGKAGRGGAQDTGPSGGLGDAAGGRRQGDQRRARPGEEPEPAGPGFWRDFDLVACGDGKARRVEPGTFPLAHGIPGRVGQLRGYGNAIIPQVAAEFVMAFMECRPSDARGQMSEVREP